MTDAVVQEPRGAKPSTAGNAPPMGSGDGPTVLGGRHLRGQQLWVTPGGVGGL